MFYKVEVKVEAEDKWNNNKLCLIILIIEFIEYGSNFTIVFIVLGGSKHFSAEFNIKASNNIISPNKTILLGVEIYKPCVFINIS